MVWHLCAFHGPIPAGAIDVEIPVVVDDVLTRTATTRFAVPAELNRVAFAVKSYPQRAIRLFTPSLEVRRILKWIRATHFTVGVVDESAVTLVPTEELSVRTSNPSTDEEFHSVFVALGTLEPADINDAILIRAKATANLTAGAWTTVKLIPEVQLEAGTYQLVGVIPYIGTTNDFKAVRFIFSGEVWRPGIPALDFNVVVDPDGVCGRGLLFGTFTHITFPEMQIYTNAGGSNVPIEVWMYLNKV